jgi:hypothetical protein
MVRISIVVLLCGGVSISGLRSDYTSRSREKGKPDLRDMSRENTLRAAASSLP